MSLVAKFMQSCCQFFNPKLDLKIESNQEDSDGREIVVSIVF